MFVCASHADWWLHLPVRVHKTRNEPAEPHELHEAVAGKDLIGYYKRTAYLATGESSHLRAT